MQSVMQKALAVVRTMAPSGAGGSSSTSSTTRGWWNSSRMAAFIASSILGTPFDTRTGVRWRHILVRCH